LLTKEQQLKKEGIIGKFSSIFPSSHLLMLFYRPNVAKINTKTFIATQRYKNACWDIDKTSSGVKNL